MDVLCDDFDLEFLKHMTPDELQWLEDEMRLAAMHGRRFFELQNSAGANTEDASAAVHMCMELACAARGERKGAFPAALPPSPPLVPAAAPSEHFGRGRGVGGGWEGGKGGKGGKTGLAACQPAHPSHPRTYPSPP